VATPKSSSVEKAVRVLRCFLGRGASLTITQVAELLNMNIATTHRYMLTLESQGLLHRREGQHYQLGMALAELGNAVVVSDVLKSTVEPFCNELINDIGEILHVGVFQQNQITYLYKAEGNLSKQTQTYVGKSLPAYCTGLGKVLLSQLNREQLGEYLNEIELKSYTANTITDKAKLREEIEKINQNNFALDNEEFEEGLFCIGVPIKQTTGDILAAISVSAPASRLNVETCSGIKNKLIECAEKISYAMFKYGQI